MKILLAVDGSPFSDVAVKEVAGRPWPPGSEVKILGCVHTHMPEIVDPLLIAYPAYLDVMEAERKRMHQVVTKAAEMLGERDSPLKIETEVLLPEAIEQNRAKPILSVVLAGLFGFFFLEKILRLPHIHGHAGEHHDHGSEHHALQPAGLLILTGDAFHNFVDGVVIATAFSVSIPLGIVTSLAVIAHEVPQELGDFVILLESGWSRRKAYWMNFVSALATLPGALMGYAALQVIMPRVPFLLAIAAASFLYIATVDLAPILHHESGFKKSLLQLTGMLLGTGTIILLHEILG